MKKMLHWQQGLPVAFLTRKFRPYLAVLLFLPLALTGCKETCPPEPNPSACTTMVTVKSSGCGTGLWGNLWLQLDNGEYLQPCESQITLAQSLQEGQRLRIGYEEISRNSPCGAPFTCLSLVPPSTPVRILCLEPVEPASCSTFVTVESNNCFPAYWGEVWLRKDNGDYLLPWEGMALNQPLKEGQRLRIGYHTATTPKNYTQICATLVALPPAEHIAVTCLEVLPAPTNGCSVEVTAVEVSCFAGVWGSTWFKLPDGSYLQPWESNITLPTGLQTGKKYRIGYDVLATQPFYDPVVLCNALLPPGTAIRVTCLEEITLEKTSSKQAN